LNNLTPQNAYFGTGQAILEKRQRIKLKTIQQQGNRVKEQTPNPIR